MKQFFKHMLICLAVLAMPYAAQADDYQLPDPGFEDWSGSAFDGKAQPKYWHGSNVEQTALGMSFKFNFTHKETGRSGSCLMVQDQVVGAAGITETGPGYASLGYPWQFLEGLNTGSATAGTKGGISFTHRPDSVSVWVRRTGDNWDKEDFHILFYSWTGTAKGASYKSKSGSCTVVTVEDEESDIRTALDANECNTTTPGGQVAEGWIYDRKNYSDWTNIRIPIFYLNDDAPKKCNILFSASNYPNFRANSGLYEGNSLYIDDVELIYSSKIQELWVGGKKWNGFDPNTSEVQYYSLGETATAIPSIEAIRGVGSLTNLKGKKQDFPGRKLSGSEIKITKGDLKSEPTVITVKSEDGKHTTTYKIQFQTAKSSNAKLANIYYTYKDKEGNSVREAIADFSPNTYNYKVSLPYGTKNVPTIEAEKQEDQQTVSVTQAKSFSDKASVSVTAANGSAKQTYSVTFEVGKLADNTLKDITVNGKSVPGFTPTQAVYKVSLPVGTTKMPEVKGVSAYAAGEQTIVYNAPANIDGGTYTISVTTPGNPVAKVYKLNFKLEASSYSYLKSLKCGDYITAFEPENTTYYVNLPLGTASLPQISWEAGDEYQKITKTDLPEGTLDGTVRVTVTAGNGDQTVYKIVFSVEKSERSTLAGIKIGGEDLPDFDPDVTSYTYALPVGTTTLPEIEPIAADEFQTISVTTAGLNGKTRITVTAGNGSTTIYQISFTVATFSDNTLKGIYLDGELIEGFEPEKEEYWVNMEQGTTARPKVTYTLQDEKLQTAAVRDFSGLNGDYKITVRPQSGASRTYIIHFAVATSSNTNLAMIYLDGTPIEGFRPDSLVYRDSLPEGVTVIPTVTFDKGEASQRVLSVLENKTQIITVTAESGAKKEYRVEFIVRASTNAYLNMIYLDGSTLAGFNKKNLEYTVQLTGDKCPVITVDKAPGQQVTITAPYGAGVAYIKVQPEEGSGNTYKIYFETGGAASAQLANIAINGVGIPGFRADSMHYEATYEKELPTISYTKKDVSQQVAILWKEANAFVHVTDSLGNKASYSILFTRVYSSDNALAGIYADGELIEGFDPDKKDYSYELEPGSTYPTLTYKTKDASQVVFFGELTGGKYGIHVAAEDGSVAVYTVAYTIKPHKGTLLKDLKVEGVPFDFVPATKTYGPFVVAQGLPLPNVTATPDEGQSVITYNADDSTQHVLVMAENGDESLYLIQYTRVKSVDVELADLLIDGKSILGFRPDSLDYIVTLPRETKVVPSINPIAKVDNQTITTCFPRPNGVAKIRVEAQNGNYRDYTVVFPVEQSDNTLLKSLYIDGISRDVHESEFVFDVPFGTTEPYELAYEAEDGQLVHLIEAPLSGITKLIVTNEKGNNSRTYSIRYIMAKPEGENKVNKIKYSYRTQDDKTVTGELVPTEGDNSVELPYGAKSFTVTDVEKNFADQTIHFFNGGIRRGATVIAISNREGEPDVTYTITPKMPEYETKGKLKSLKYKSGGVWRNVPHFSPDVFNYMVNVKSKPAVEDFEAIDFEDNKIDGKLYNEKLKRVVFNVSGGETYNVCWFYEEDDAPFTFNWVQTDKAHFYTVKLISGILGFEADDAGEREPTGYKPKGWSVPADLLAGINYDATVSNFTYYTGKEVTQIDDHGAILSTIRGGALNSSLPGVMTLGGLRLSNGVKLNGNTTVAFSKTMESGVTYRNTPDVFEFEYQPIMKLGIDTWNAWLLLGNGEMDSVEYMLSGNYDDYGKGIWKKASQNLSYNFIVQKLNILLCASEINKKSGSYTDELSIYAGKEPQSADLQIRNVRLVYDSKLKGAKVKVNGQEKDAVLQDDQRTFLYTVGDNEEIVGVPMLKFTKNVIDQMQTIEWLNDGEWLNGELKARVVNYGENSQDSTQYYVVLKREPVTSVNYKAEFGSLTTTKGTKDTLYVNLPYGTKRMPDLTITPNSIHQIVTMSKNGNAVTVSVKAENGADSTTVYVFREDLSNEVALEALSLEGTAVLNIEDEENFIYSVEADKMPLVEYTKKRTDDDKTIGQTVDLNYSLNGAVLTVTAGDGVTQRTYTINRLDPTTPTSGQIKEFALGGDPWDKLGGTTYSVESDRPKEPVTFERKDTKDSVVYIQAPDKMEWQVFGSENHTYTLNYPSGKSSNANLADLLINGEPYDGFSPTESEFTIESDSLLILTPVEAEQAQAILTTQATGEGDIVVYTTVVTAADGTTKKTYKTSIRTPRSSNGLLDGITLDGELIDGFRPDSLIYTVTIPAPAVKIEQPHMPCVHYVLGQKGQKVEVTPGQMNGDDTEIVVESEDGIIKNTYTLSVVAAPSACADLTGITINGDAVDQFEPGRHFYSQSLATNSIEVDYLSDDRFQTVTMSIDTIKEEHEYLYTLHVTAEDGHSANYEVTIYVENQSNDAQLANITLDGKNFDDFERALNEALTFDGGNNNYEINLPAGTTVLPEVSAQLKMDGQHVEIIQKQDSILLTVTAVDGITTNTYVLRFIVPLSKNAELSMIFLNGDSLPNFKPDYFFYQIDLPVGTNSLPEVAAQKGEAAQNILPIEIDDESLQATIKVEAEDRTRSNTYVVVFHYTQSNADTLAMIYQDGQPLEDFDAQIKYYTKSLPVGTVAFPELSWQEADDWQTIHMDTVESAANTLIRQIIVTAESGKKNTYTVSYTIEKSDVDTLQMLFVDQKALADFAAETTEYYYQLTAAEATALEGALPVVEYITGDEYQTVLVSQAPDSLSGKSLGYKSIVTVTAATGKMRTYAIHYPVELSTDATLNMINVGGKPLANFDAERYAYKLEIEKEDLVPVVSVIKKEEAQVYEIQVMEDTVQVIVWAESVKDSATYTLSFERLKSKVSLLKDIVLTNAAGEQIPSNEFPYRPEIYSYLVNLTFDSGKTPIAQLPMIQTVLYDNEQKCDTAMHILPSGDIQIDITVTAPNGEDQTVYSITFHFVKPSDAMLLSLKVNGVELPEFRPTIYEYTYAHPYGTTEEQYFTADSISYVLSDSLAVAEVTMQDGVIYITVTAQDGRTSNTYVLMQTTAKDGDNALAWITIDGDTISGFDPDVLFYTYYIMEGGSAPSVDAGARSENAEVDKGRVTVGDTCTITCTAADGSERYYLIHFAISSINPGKAATANDVLLKPAGNHQFLAVTTRNGVSISLYNQSGLLVFHDRVPVVDPNDADIVNDADDKEKLNNVSGTGSGLLIDVIPGQPYFYVFFANEKTKLSSGKIMDR